MLAPDPNIDITLFVRQEPVADVRFAPAFFSGALGYDQFGQAVEKKIYINLLRTEN